MAQPGAKPAGKMDLSDMTKLSADVSKRDLEELIAETVDTDKSDYCVVTGIHVHNWAPQVRARSAVGRVEEAQLEEIHALHAWQRASSRSGWQTKRRQAPQWPLACCLLLALPAPRRPLTTCIGGPPCARGYAASTRVCCSV